MVERNRNLNSVPGEDSVLTEAQDRFEFCQTVYSTAQKNWDEDFKFANADSENAYQWDGDLRRTRELDQRPCLTVNKVRQHNLAIINEAKQNKPGIKIMPAGNGATVDSAQAWMSLIRRIEYQSNAQALYSNAMKFAVDAGLGFIRVVTRYVDDKSFDQDVFFEGIPNPLLVYLDPEAKEPDKSDARYGFIFEDMNHKEAKKKYPQYANLFTGAPLAFGNTPWLNQDNVRVCEYYRLVEKEFTLYATQYNVEDPNTPLPQPQYYPEDQLRGVPDLLKAIKAHPSTRSRQAIRKHFEWKFIVGNTIAEEKIWPGELIPIVPVLPEELTIDGKLTWVSHTRAMRDPQRIYNYWTSTAVEFGALQTKTPWTAPAQAIEGYEDYWENANVSNYSWLPWNAFDESGQALPAPQRIAPPISSPVALDGVKLAGMELEMASGQYAPAMGQPDNSRTGKAINERQRMGDRAVYHYIDAMGTALRALGRICLDIIPKIYDTQRAMMILAENGVSFEVKIDPVAMQAYQQEQQSNAMALQRVFNPAIGKYDVVADNGPGYATKREEAFQAFTLILTQAPQLAGVIGDLMLEAGDFPLQDEAAQRLKRMVPPQALGLGPSPQEQQLQQENVQLKQLLQKLSDEYGRERLRSNSRAEMRDIDAYNAITKRLDVTQKAQFDAHTAALEQTQLQQDILRNTLAPVDAKVQSDLSPGSGNPAQGAGQEAQGQLTLPFPRSESAKIPGAAKAPDGHWYIKDPARPGKFLRVMAPPVVGPGGQMQGEGQNG